MLQDVAVIDAVVHGPNFHPSNLLDSSPGRIHEQVHLARAPRQPQYQKYVLARERYEQRHVAEELVSTCFAESATDIAVFHAVRRTGSLNRGEWSPLQVGLDFRSIAGEPRVRVMAALTDPFDTLRSIDELDEVIERDGACGLSLHAWDWDARAQRLREFRFDDTDISFPILEHLRARRIRAVGCHKAIGSTTKALGLADVDAAAEAFPDLDFEVVLAGSAVVDGLCELVRRSNVYVSLEGTTSFLGVAPTRFAHDLGRLLGAGAGAAQDRILWATGAMSVHPQPLLELFWEFRMPEDLIERCGYPELTADLKRQILGGNYARKSGIDLDVALAAIPDDPMRRAQEAGDYAEPWSKVPDPKDQGDVEACA